MEEDIWSNLRKLTNARIGMGRAGTSLKTSSVLDFRKGHALARDAVHTPLDEAFMMEGIQQLGLAFEKVQSSAPDRLVYLQRPDLGRSLSNNSREELANAGSAETELCLILADGLSSMAIHRHALPFLQVFLTKMSKRYSMGPIILARQARVALGDEIGGLLRAQIAVVLIGERPGLSAPDSMGIYMTYHPYPGLTDESRNCISNIHAHGLSYALAADKLLFLIQESLRRKLSGVHLKENTLLIE